MQLCSACLAVRAGDGDTARHAVLQITDTRRSKLPNEGIVTVSTFRCQACGACWTTALKVVTFQIAIATKT